MDQMVIAGGIRLKGEVEISGAKNAALPILASLILTDGPCKLENVPDLRDIRTICQLLSQLGAEIKSRDNGDLVLDPSGVSNWEAPYSLVKTMRASVLALGPLLARLGKARVSLPGGCAIGARPINLHLKGFEALGAKITIEHGYVIAECKRLKGARIYLDIPTVTGTENLMMAAALAQGESILENAACEPEIVDLAETLNEMGAQINGAGTETIHITGVKYLKPLTKRIIPDRIETGTFITAAAMTGGEIVVKNCRPAHCKALILKLREAGVRIESDETTIHVIGPKRVKAVDVKTLPHPGFPTDMQAQFMALMAISGGLSVITETVFENRFMHVGELIRMGADIVIQGNHAIVKGVEKLSGAPIMATDLRASASLIIAALAAEGESVLSRVYHIDRGYERIEEKLSKLGANIKRINNHTPN
ncbi:MAG: UDP-N-acetylglucosamine 1-carboxyvinyltransferase [Candidatus Tectomicrobia bacterium]|uniref:UDP-N-acetylglucosamine 1-carboxyvinyltransferase n=1 Tax=Tectimicrobiota bacterium TaxID=2528274 RepID=A0A933GMN4_UNCTE|nr:UDP-N-acetylglucosamine 1-carboxyvinyltransferase [Candidatus Tectomicrobia bacterium]